MVNLILVDISWLENLLCMKSVFSLKQHVVHVKCVFEICICLSEDPGCHAEYLSKHRARNNSFLLFVAIVFGRADVCVSAVNNNETIHLWQTRWEMRASLDDFFPAALLTDKHSRLNPSGELDGRLRRQSYLLKGGILHLKIDRNVCCYFVS